MLYVGFFCRFVFLEITLFLFDSKKLNLRLFTNAIKLDKHVDDSYTINQSILMFIYPKTQNESL